MTVEKKYAIAIAMLCDWLKNLAPLFQPLRRKTKTNRTLYARFFPCFDEIAWNPDWFIALFAPVVIGRNNYFVIGQFDIHLKSAL